MQPTAIRLGASASANCAGVASDLLRIALGYGPSGTLNNGNVREQTITQPTLTASQSFEYDELNRVSTASEGSDYRNFGYSATGNMWVTAASPGWTPPSFTPRTSAWFDANNRLGNAGLGVQYDAAGNQTAIGAYTFTYDAENRLKSSTIAGAATTYAYDGEGRRVKKTAGGVSTVYVYNAAGELAAEYGGPAQTPGTRYLTTDHLGSTRLVTDASGNVLSRHDYLPFGEEISAGIGGRTAAMGYVANNSLTQRFTGKERDAETGLDYSFARYLSSAQGRFTSPDAPFADQDSAYPQSWNLYTYVRNNPLRYIDPTGRNCVNLDNGTQGDDGQGTPCAGAQLGTTHGVTVGVGRDEANLIMLQGIGEGLSSPHQIATIVSEAGQGAMMVSSVRSLPSLWRGLRSWWVGEGLIQLGIANSNGGVLAGAKFAQTTASAMFSSTGKFAGKSVDEVANALRSGSLHPADVPIEYAVRDGNTLILNTRSAMALEKAGIPRSNWNAINVTNDAAAQARLSGQLERNGLTSAGTDSVRMK